MDYAWKESVLQEGAFSRPEHHMRMALVSAGHAGEGVSAGKRQKADGGHQADSDLLFNDASSSDVVVRIFEREGTDVLNLHVHQSLLIKNSSYFSARLSDRWKETCARDASGRPVVELRECENARGCAAALRKLYERAPGDWEDSGGVQHSFASFEDALQCLEPADQLCLSSVWTSAVAYLDCVSWSELQAEQLKKVVAQVGGSLPQLLERLDPPTEELNANLLKLVLAKATADKNPHAGARSLVRDILSRSTVGNGRIKMTRVLIVEGLRERLSEMKVALSGMNLEGISSKRPDSTRCSKLATCYERQLMLFVDNLAWMFQLPQSGESGDIRRDFARTMLQIRSRCDPQVYKQQVFHCHLAEPLYLPVMKAGSEGALLIGSGMRVDLLKMWVPRQYAERGVQHSEEMQAAFTAVFKSLSYKKQEDALDKWLEELTAKSPWEPWFDEWMRTCLLDGLEKEGKTRLIA